MDIEVARKLIQKAEESYTASRIKTQIANRYYLGDNIVRVEIVKMAKLKMYLEMRIIKYLSIFMDYLSIKRQATYLPLHRFLILAQIATTKKSLIF